MARSVYLFITVGYNSDMDDTRFYSFVAGLYLSELQKGLQTAHAVSEMYALYRDSQRSPEFGLFDRWADKDKTLVILSALNSKGVLDAHTRLCELAPEFCLPISLFCEDKESLNGAATACGVVVPRRFYDVKHVPATPQPTNSLDASLFVPEHYLFIEDKESGTGMVPYFFGSKEFEFIYFLKSYRLA